MRDQVKKWIKEYGTIVASAAAGIVLTLICLLLVRSCAADEPEEDEQKEQLEQLFMEEELIKEEKTAEQSEKTHPSVVMIDIKGAVNNPGVYELDEDARLLDAIEQAGGLAQGAVTDGINLAKQVTDQMMIYVPVEGEDVPEDVSAQQDSIQSDEDFEEALININKADVSRLTQLKGIGDVRAQSIIEYREEHGEFETTEELKKVSGIGEGIFGGVKDKITVKE